MRKGKKEGVCKWVRGLQEGGAGRLALQCQL